MIGRGVSSRKSPFLKIKPRCSCRRAGMDQDAASTDLRPPGPHRRPRRTARRVAAALALLVALPGTLFVINGTILSRGETPELHVLADETATSRDEHSTGTVKILAYNIAKCFVFEDGTGLASANSVNERLGRIAELINSENPDFVCLSETVVECGPCPVNQVSSLATATGMHAWAFGENYNFGVPLFRVAGGN